MNNKSDDVIREWVLQFFAIIEKEYGHAPERLDMDIRLKTETCCWCTGPLGMLAAAAMSRWSSFVS